MCPKLCGRVFELGQRRREPKSEQRPRQMLSYPSRAKALACRPRSGARRLRQWASLDLRNASGVKPVQRVKACVNGLTSR